MIEFILNDKLVIAVSPPTIVLLDFLRSEQKLMGTKEGCREGDCGACTVLLGELSGNKIKYKNINSCLLPLGDVHGKHVVTIEGISSSGLSKIQESFVNEGGTQCGFCTPGFIVSLTGYFLNTAEPDFGEAVNYLSGNICRCTGYEGIKRSVAESIKYFKASGPGSYTSFNNPLLPEYFAEIPKRLKKIKPLKHGRTGKRIISGGTDIYVQNQYSIDTTDAMFISDASMYKSLSKKGNRITIGAAVTLEEIRNSTITKKHLPQLHKDLNLFGSLPIRNRATIGGNIVNASPIGDMTNILLALNAELILVKGKRKRKLSLQNLYKGYKTLSKDKNEIVSSVVFNVPSKYSFFNYEKVSKRTYLDIASVNSSILIEVKKNIITEVSISAGGVSAIPLHLSDMCTFLRGKTISNESVKNAVGIALTEISPISDARGSAEYKKLLLRQLLYAHFIKLFPDLIEPEKLI